MIVGASVAGVRTAQALRSEGFEGPVLLVGAEPVQPYDKPPLSKQFLAGHWDADRIRLLDPASAAGSGIQLRLGVPAEHLDVAARVVRLADGEELGYDVCVLATGATARPAPWPARAGVHVLRTLADSASLRERLRGGGPVVVVGAGFIGAEVAGTARALGCEVSVVDALPVPMARLLGPEVGAMFLDLHARHGVAARFGVGVEGIEESATGLRVLLTDGSVLSAATVVVGIGAVPADSWLASSGLLVDDGVVCDEHCRAVDAPEVFAAGDVARWFHPGYREHVRVEHWTNAVEQAACVAYNITHPESARAYAPVEYVWSDQYDWRIQLVGRPLRGVGHHVVGDLAAPAPRAAVAYADPAGRLCAGVTVNWPRALARLRRMVAAGASAAQAAEALAALSEASPAVGPG